MEEAAHLFISQLSVPSFQKSVSQRPARALPLTGTQARGDRGLALAPLTSQSSLLTGTGLSLLLAKWGSHLTGWTMLPFPRPICPHLGQAPNPWRSGSVTASEKGVSPSTSGQVQTHKSTSGDRKRKTRERPRAVGVPPGLLENAQASHWGIHKGGRQNVPEPAHLAREEGSHQLLFPGLEAAEWSPVLGSLGPRWTHGYTGKKWPGLSLWAVASLRLPPSPCI